MSGKKVIFVLADGFEELETVAPADILKRLGASVILSGLEKKTVTGAHGIRMETDCLLCEAGMEDTDAIVLPGGLPGAVTLRDSAALGEILRLFDSAGKICAAICASPNVFAHAGIWRNRPMTGYPGSEGLSGVSGLKFTGSAAEQSGNLVTGRGPGAACDFGAAIARALGFTPDAVDKILKEMLILP